MQIVLQGETLHLLAARAIYWPARAALLIADLHLGKSGHFRRHGIPVPAAASTHTLDRLAALLQQYQPQQVIFLGDLFHSHYNAEWEAFVALMRDQAATATLVRGNHDLLSPEAYAAAGLTVVPDCLHLPPFALAHAPLGRASEAYRLAGHLHPGVALTGKGRQRLRLPCFHFGAHEGVLPAFGQFTGLALVEPAPEDRVYVVAEAAVLPVALGA